MNSKNLEWGAGGLEFKIFGHIIRLESAIVLNKISAEILLSQLYPDTKFHHVATVELFPKHQHVDYMNGAKLKDKEFILYDAQGKLLDTSLKDLVATLMVSLTT